MPLHIRPYRNIIQPKRQPIPRHMYLRPRRRRRIPKRHIRLILIRFLALLNPTPNYPQSVVKDHQHGVGVHFGDGGTGDDEGVCEGEVED